MLFRELGKTGKRVGEIGIGCEHLDGKPYEQIKETVDAALAHGVNIFDVFMPGHTVRENIAKAIGDRRGQVMIQGHIGSTDLNQQYDITRDLPSVQKYFEDILRLFGGYIDFGMMFFIDSEKDYKGVFETEFIGYVERLKKQGDIRHVGFSSHNPEIAMKVIETGVPEMLLFSINPAFDMLPSGEYVFDHIDNRFGADLFRGTDPVRARFYKLCTQRQVGITVMKTLGAGKLLSKEHSPFAEPLTVPQCIHYALSRPAVGSVMLGCKTAAEVNEAMRYFELSDDEKDYSRAISGTRNDFAGNCLYCSHCQPCPSGIDIAAVNKYLDIARLDKKNIPPSVKSHYKGLEHGGDACVGCGSCESKCPFAVPVIKNMAEAAELFA